MVILLHFLEGAIVDCQTNKQAGIARFLQHNFKLLTSS